MAFLIMNENTVSLNRKWHSYWVRYLQNNTWFWWICSHVFLGERCAVGCEFCLWLMGGGSMSTGGQVRCRWSMVPPGWNNDLGSNLGYTNQTMKKSRIPSHSPTSFYPCYLCWPSVHGGQNISQGIARPRAHSSSLSIFSFLHVLTRRSGTQIMALSEWQNLTSLPCSELTNIRLWPTTIIDFSHYSWLGLKVPQRTWSNAGR